MRAWLNRLLRSRDAATVIEYAFIASLISIAAAGILLSIGTELSSVFSTVANKW